MWEAQRCPNCGGRIGAEASRFGRLVFCPHCRESFQIGEPAMKVEGLPEDQGLVAAMSEYLSNARLDSSFWLG